MGALNVETASPSEMYLHIHHFTRLKITEDRDIYFYKYFPSKVP